MAAKKGAVRRGKKTSAVAKANHVTISARAFQSLTKQIGKLNTTFAALSKPAAT